MELTKYRKKVLTPPLTAPSTAATVKMTSDSKILIIVLYNVQKDSSLLRVIVRVRVKANNKSALLQKNVCKTLQNR